MNSILAGYSEHSFQRAWNKSLLRLTGLRSDTGQCVDLLDVGRWNHHGGPDFLDAQIVLDGHLFRGAIELHRNPAEWYRHGHHLDAAYNCVVLHAAPMPSKRAIIRSDGTRVPHVDISRVMPTWLPAASMSNTLLACHAFLPSNLDLLDRQLSYASSAYFEELTARLLGLIRSNDNPASETLRALYIRACSVLGAPANRETMEEVAATLWDEGAGQRPDEPLANRFAHLSWRHSGGRPASWPSRRLQQAYDLASVWARSEPSMVLMLKPNVVMQTLFPSLKGTPTGNVIFSTVLLPAMWVHATLIGDHAQAADHRSAWYDIPLRASPEAEVLFGRITSSVDARHHKALTWQHRNVCAAKNCGSCLVGIRMLR